MDGEVAAMLTIARAGGTALTELIEELNSELNVKRSEPVDHELVLPLAREIQSQAGQVFSRIETYANWRQNMERREH